MSLSLTSLRPSRRTLTRASVAIKERNSELHAWTASTASLSIRLVCAAHGRQIAVALVAVDGWVVG